MLEKAKNAKKEIGNLSTEKKNKALNLMAESLLTDSQLILQANEQDLENAKGKLSDVMLDRLRLNQERIEAMAKGILDVVFLDDPVGKILNEMKREDGLLIQKVRVPLGVIAVIYESRPNVTSDVAALALKSGNVCILRSGKDAFFSARAIVQALKKGLKKAGVSEDAIHLIQDPSRESAVQLMKAKGFIDLLIPRGGASLIQSCVQNATVPCVETGTGICHAYVEKSADLEMAVNIIENGKMSRPSVCNALEVLLVDEWIAEPFLVKLKKRLVEDRIAKGLIPVEFRSDEKGYSLLQGKLASEQDYDTEFLDYILAVQCVKNTEEAIRHISLHSSGHSEVIISQNEEAIQMFLQQVDSAAVYVNASTRFTDGGEFGLGCEIGISTQKLHARGPMGLNELCTYKYMIYGNGQIR